MQRLARIAVVDWAQDRVHQMHRNRMHRPMHERRTAVAVPALRRSMAAIPAAAAAAEVVEAELASIIPNQ